MPSERQRKTIDAFTTAISAFMPEETELFLRYYHDQKNGSAINGGKIFLGNGTGMLFKSGYRGYMRYKPDFNNKSEHFIAVRMESKSVDIARIPSYLNIATEEMLHCSSFIITRQQRDQKEVYYNSGFLPKEIWDQNKHDIQAAKGMYYSDFQKGLYIKAIKSLIKDSSLSPQKHDQLAASVYKYALNELHEAQILPKDSYNSLYDPEEHTTKAVKTAYIIANLLQEKSPVIAEQTREEAIDCATRIIGVFAPAMEEAVKNYIKMRDETLTRLRAKQGSLSKLYQNRHNRQTNFVAEKTARAI